MAKIIEKDPNTAHSSKAKSNGHDAYCWICHNLKTTVFCSTCPRSYHSLCTRNNQDGNEWRCDCCLKLDKARSNWAKWTFDSNSLKIVLNRNLGAKELKVFNTIPSSDLNENTLINPIDLGKIKKKIEANEYETPEEFYVDVKWVQHNFSIIHPNNPKYENISTDFVAACELELTSLSHCTDCYERSEKRARGWFTSYCIPPHLLIWAKCFDYPYWPGKLMSADDKMVDVQFFGDHTFETVSIDNCFIYSEEHPEKATFQVTSLFEAAQEECQKYIKRLKARFGDFKYGKKGEKLDLNKIKYHLENMFPKIHDDDEHIDIQFKRLIPMDMNNVMNIDDSPLNASDTFIIAEELSDSNETENKKVGSPKNPEKTVDDPIDLVELKIQAIFGSDEPEKVDDELDPLEMDSQRNDNLSESKSSTVDSESSAEVKGESNVNERVKSLKRKDLVSLGVSKRMRLIETECIKSGSSEGSESSSSCDSVFSQVTVDFEFDKKKVTDKNEAAVEQPLPLHDVVHSTQSTPPPIVSTGISGFVQPIRAYIEALERLKDHLLSQNTQYVEKLELMVEENRKLREENICLFKKNETNGM